MWCEHTVFCDLHQFTNCSQKNYLFLPNMEKSKFIHRKFAEQSCKYVCAEINAIIPMVYMSMVILYEKWRSPFHNLYLVMAPVSPLLISNFIHGFHLKIYEHLQVSALSKKRTSHENPSLNFRCANSTD